MEVPGQVRPPSGLWSSSKAGAAHRWCAAPVYVENAPLRGGGPSCPVALWMCCGGVSVPSSPLVALAASVARRVASKPGVQG